MIPILKKMIPVRIKEKIKKKYIEVKYKIKLKKGVKVSLKTQFDGNPIIGCNTNIINSRIGFGTYICNDCFMPNTAIGRFCSIASKVRTDVGLHPSKKYVSTHPAFFSLQKQAGFTFVNSNKFQENKYIDKHNKFVVKIGSDVWIGYNVTIMDGINIGDGAIIGTGAIVTKDIEPYSINVGVPAKKIGYRFEKQYINFLLNFKWWNKNINWIEKNANLFTDIKKLYREFHK